MSMLWLLATRALEKGCRAPPRGVCDPDGLGGDDMRDAACDAAAAAEPDAARGTRDGYAREVR